MTLLVYTLLLLALLAVIIGNVMILVAAFRQSLLWGLATLFLPFAQVIFLLRHWEKSRCGFLLGLGGALLFVGTVFSLPNREDRFGGGWEKALARSGFAAPGASSSGKIKDLTGRIEEKRSDISRLEGAYAQSAATLAGQYKEITAKRQALNVNDPAAVRQFNEEAAAYHQLNNQVKQTIQDLSAAKQELEALLAERSKTQAAPAEALK
ncbi:MAG: hypothetical protein PHQ12_05850 [Chthoniobacteraceae bacterium]|nr:hypothetical protein [Chthoniobacteraceae bacterium]